ncbi:MAG: hypothetical protein Q8M29_06190 [Bacteroidota bacterium]|nr:hypothetical protein [Bacteroidota bacterium]
MKTTKQDFTANRLLNRIKNFRITEVAHIHILAFWITLITSLLMMLYMISKW